MLSGFKWENEAFAHMAFEPQDSGGVGATESQTGWNRVVIDHSTHILESIYRLAVYTSVYLAAIAMLEVLVVMHVLSIPLNYAPIIAGLLTLSVYLNDRVADVDTDEVNTPKRSAFIRRHKQILYVVGSVSYGLAVGLSALAGPLAFGLAMVPGIFWVMYAIDWGPKVGASFMNLKKILIVNSATVAFGWSIVIVGLPLTFGVSLSLPTAGIVFLYFFIGTFISTEIPNVRDVEGDRETGSDTLPVVFGVRKTRYILYGVVLFIGAILAIGFSNDFLTSHSMVALTAGLIYLLGVITLVGRTNQEQMLTMASECSRIPVFIALLAPNVII